MLRTLRRAASAQRASPSNPSLSRKVTMALLLASAFSLAVACAAFILFDVFSGRVSIRQNLERNASIAAQLTAQAFERGNAAEATRQLASVGQDENVSAVYLFDGLGQVFAQYVRPVPEGTPPPTAAGADFEDHTSSGYQVQRLAVGSQRQGTLVMRYSLASYNARIQRYLILAVFVLMGTLVASYGIANQLQMGIVAPIRHLTDTVRTVATQRTFDVRADVPGGDEIGELAVHFNEMLQEIERRDDRLARHRQYLEQQVAMRTADLVRSNEALARERDRAEAASQLKTELMTNMSHEFRTPIAGIIGLSSILRDEVEPVHVEFVDLMAQNAHRLMDTLSAVLDLSQIESGDFRSVPTYRDAGEMARELAERWQRQAEEKGLLFRLVLPEEPVDAIVDGSCVGTVLRHLLSNALKFTDAGEVTLRLAVADDTLRFSVEDTGIGIAPAQREDLFEPFVQGSSGAARTHEGNGIGLTIARRMARALGGDVDVASTPGRGSTFAFTLPRFAELPPVLPSDAPPDDAALAHEHPVLLASAPTPARALAGTPTRLRGTSPA